MTFGDGATAATTPRSASRFVTRLHIAVGFAVLGLHVAVLGDWMLDDAFVFFRYAENWARGLGPVFNSGERVEGYSSFVWLALLTAAKRSGCDPVLAARVLGCAFAVATLLLVARAHRLLPALDRETSHRAALFTGTCGAFTAWAASGMEVVLAAFLTTLATLSTARLSSREQRATPRALGGLGALMALLVATRPEAILIDAVLLFTLVRCAPRRAWISIATFALLFLPYFGWRWGYYGWPLPNPFYAKVGGTMDELRRGATYVLRFLRLAAPLVVFVVVAALRRKSLAPRGVVPAVIAAQVVFAIVAGGDLMPAFRFIAPVVPLLVLLASHAIGVVVSNRRVVAATLLVAASGVAGMRFDPDVYGRIRGDRVARAGAIVGKWMRDNLPADALLATNTAGSLPYFSGLRCIDMLGLTDTHIAHRRTSDLGRGWAGHEKFDGAYVLSRRPDYVQFASALGSERPAFPSDHDLWKQPGFLELYELRTYELQLASGVLPVHLYRRRDGRGP